MTTTGAGQLLIEALSRGDAAAFDAFAGALAPTVQFVSAVTPTLTGPDDVVGQLRRFVEAGRFARATEWAISDEEGVERVSATFPLDSFYARYVWDLTLDAASKATRIAQTGVQQTEPLPESPVRLDEQIRAALRIAGETRNPLIVAYVNGSGQPSQAPRGTVQVFSETQLALWLHNRGGGLATAVASNDNVSLHYWGGIGTEFGGALLFQGHARIDDRAEVRRVVYEGSPASEQRTDPDHLGCALIVDLTSVTGFIAGRRYNMATEVMGA